MGLEGVAELVRAGVTHRARHFAYAAARVEQEFPGLRHPDLNEVMVKGHAEMSREEVAEVSGIHFQLGGHLAKAHWAVVMPMYVGNHFLHNLWGVRRRLTYSDRRIRVPSERLALVGGFSYEDRHPALQLRQCRLGHPRSEGHG